MIIRAQQMETFARHSREMANKRLAEYARQRFPALCVSRTEQDMLRIAETVRCSAGQWGFEREDHVATWLDLMAMYGPDFPRSAWAAPILQNPELARDGKIEALTRAVRRSGARL